MNKSIQVIVPVYYGKKYIETIIRQIEDNKRQCENVDVGLLLINDAPDDPIEKKYSSNYIDIQIFNTNRNRGIHGARVEGLKKTESEYILFLDQDDMIAPNYLKSQLEAIKDADASVCRCMNGGYPTYNEVFKFEQVITKEYAFSKGNPIVSVGQVLLRKAAIPPVWQENIMKTNCVDDFFLWLVMFHQNKKFVLNWKTMFEHVVDGTNRSFDVNVSFDSLQEMYQILAAKEIFPQADLEKVNDMIWMHYRRRVSDCVKTGKMFQVLNQWLICREQGQPIGKWLSQEGLRKIAIYGNSHLGKRLRGELKDSNIEICFFIDRNARYLQDQIPIYTLEDAPNGIDGVIITLIENYDAVVNDLQIKYGRNIYTIIDIIKECQR